MHGPRGDNPMEEPAVELVNVIKRFDDVIAVDNVS
jgi:hypothetical protein